MYNLVQTYPVSIFSNTSIRPLPCPLPQKPLLKLKINVKCQNIKRCIVEGSHMLNMFVRLCAREAKWLMYNVSFKVNCHKWPITGHTRSWYTEMRYWKQCLQAPLLISPQPPHSSCATFFDPPFLEPGTGLFVLVLPHVNSWCIYY